MIMRTADQKKTPLRKGSSGKIAWRAARWVQYHVEPSRWRMRDMNDEQKAQIGKDITVRVIDMMSGSITDYPYPTFKLLNQSPEKVKQMAQEAIGLYLGLEELQILMRSGALNGVMQTRVNEFLESLKS